MTHWRETGIVPASDGEDSDGELSTQEDEVDVFQLVSQFVPPDTTSQQSTQTEPVQLHDGKQDALGVEAEVEPETVPMDIDISPPKQRFQETVKKTPIMIMDLAYPDDDKVDEDMDLEGGVSLKVPATKSRTSNITPRDTPRFGSPDPITGELQPLSGLVPQLPRAVTEAPLIASPISPSLSSPLSSAPSNPSTPSAAPQADTVGQPAIGFEVVIPTGQSDAPVIPPESPNYQRSFRQRKPIQMHPYLLEDAKYKAHMRERGVQPVRIQYSQTEAPSRPANDDSQDAEFPAPPVDDDSQPRRDRRQKSKEQDGRKSPRRSILPGRQEVPTTAQRGDSSKRRKTGHLSVNSRASLSGGRPSFRQPGNMNAEQDNVDVYNIPDSPSPTRLPRLTFGQRSTNPQHMAGHAAIPSSGMVKRVGLLSLLNDSDDSDESPPLLPPQMPSSTIESSPQTRTRTPVRRIPPIVMSIGSSPEPAVDPTTIPSEDDEASSFGSESGFGSDDSMPSTTPVDPGKSRIVSRFAKKGMRGVLPASFIRLNKPRAPQEPPEPHQHDRHSATPPGPEARPGVARSKVSSRLPSGRVNDLFHDDNNSDSGNEPVLLSSVPARKEKPKKTPSARPLPINLEYDSDIPEDNRFDPSGSGAKRSNTSKRGPKKTSKSTSGQKRASSSRTQNQGSRRATTGTPRARRPAGPSVGIVDAYRYARTSKMPMPDFARLAAREASRRPNQGRQSPRTKLFVMDNAQDTRDVQDVLRNWREGTLPFRAPSPEIPRTDVRGRDQPTSTAQTRLPSPERFGGSAHRTQLKKLPGIRRSTGSSKSRQTSLLNHFPNESAKVKPRAKRSAPKPLTINSNNKSYITHGPAFAPQPAQIERALPPGQQVTGWRGRLEDLADTLQRRISTQKAAARRRAPLQPLASGVDVPSAAPNHFTQTALLQPRRIRRKGTPRRIDADTVEHRQPTPEALVLDDYFAPVGNQPVQLPQLGQSGGPQRPRLSGLLPYGQKYTLNFDIHPLRNGVYFNSDTSIGRGDLTKAFVTAPARVSGFTATATFTFGGEILRWGVYEDNVATQFESVMDKIGDASERFAENESPNDNVVDLEMRGFEQQAYYFFGFVVSYIADVLTFHDPLDVIAFGQRFLQAIEHCCERGVVGSGEDSLKRPATKLTMRANAFGLLIARQIQLLTAGEEEIQEKLELPRILKNTGRQLVSRLVRCRFNCIRECYEDQRRRVKFEQGIGPEHFIVEIWVMAIQMLSGAEPGNLSFWTLLNEQLQAKAAETCLEVQTFEKLWKALFTVLPLFQFDDAGMAMGVGEDKVLKDNWTLVRILTARPLKVYNANREGQSGTINNYTRLLFARAHYLMTRWFWSNPEKIIPTLYDFFGSTGLKMLKNEDHHGSADFVMNLDKSPSLEVHDSDACFHLLLKTIAVGLQQMTARNVKKKTVDNIVNRLMPNHRRQYPKDEDLSYVDLAILRNHHDLMVTLYWAAPPGSRPPIDAIQLLVNPENTHIGACHVVVRAWSNIIRFQLHSGEGPEQLVVMMEWFDYLVTKLLGQHQAARSDAEKQLAAAKADGDFISNAHFEENVKQNQRRVEAVLNDLVKSLRLEMANIPGDVQSAVVLLTKDSTATILKASTRWSHKLMLEVLQLIRQFVLTCRGTASARTASAALQESNEESQDYGDVSIFEDFEFDGDAPVDMVHDEKRAAKHLLTQSSSALYQLLSNCFGADKQPEEALLTNTVNTWCIVAGFLVKNGFKSWDTYLRHGTESWSSLRDTPQTRKFTSYFMPKIIEHGGSVYEENRSDFLLFWMKALVERDSMLAFQNQYTSTLLNCDESNPILANPPFVRDPSSGKFKISQLEFRSGRLALVSSVLERMRTSYEEAVGRDADDRKREYAELLREMMNGMKENYQELQASTHTGDYVKFAHGVIEFLQQHTTEIVAIDKFFTENSAFPLPANDPNYVVGRLKKYAAKLSQPRSQYQLNSFFQSQCERTALTGTQVALIQHIVDAVDAESEHGDPAHPTLRAYFLHCLFPVYLSLIFGATAGWVVTIPLLHSLRHILTTLDTAVDTTSPASLLATTQILDSTLASLRLAVSSAIHAYRNDTFETPDLSAPLLTALTLLVRCTTAAIPSISRYHAHSLAANSADFILRAAHYAHSIINPNYTQETTLPGLLPDAPSALFTAARKAAAQAIGTSVARQWGKADGGWYFQRGNMREKITPPIIEDIRSVRRGLVKAIHELMETAARSEVFSGVVRELAPEATGGARGLGVALGEVFV